MNKSGKALLVIGTTLKSQIYFVKKICSNIPNLVYVDTKKVFEKTCKSISSDYFYNELSFFQKFTNKKFVDYLDLLYFIQKLQHSEIQLLYKDFYKKAQYVNNIILYRYYEDLYLEINKLINKGKNCIFIENIYNDPYPERNEVFFKFFNILGDNFKNLHIYTDISTTIRNSINNNNNIINSFLSKKSIKKSGDNFEHPLFTLELFPLLYEITEKPDKNIFEQITGKSLKNAYLESIYQAKKLLGFFVSKQIPYFYHKQSILNEIGKSFLYLKDFKDNSNLYIINKRTSYNYNIIESNYSTKESLDKNYTNLIRNIKSWIFDDKYIPYLDSYSKTKSSLIELSSVEFLFKTKLPFSKKEEVSKVLNNPSVFFIDTIFTENTQNNILKEVITLFFKNKSADFFLRVGEKKWSYYTIKLLENNTFQILFYNNSNITVEKDELHLIMVNYIYIEIAKKLNSHIFIDIINLNPEEKKYLELINQLNIALSIIQ